MPPPTTERVLEAIEKSLGEVDDVSVLAAAVGDEEREFVSAESCQRVVLAQASLKPLDHGFEKVVAHGVAQTVVDVLEPIEVQEHDRHCTIGLVGLHQGALEPVLEQETIAHAGQRIVLGPVLGGSVGEHLVQQVQDQQ